jgi:hypothetical protein
MNHRGARAIPDADHRNFFQSLNVMKSLYDTDLPVRFAKKFQRWITNNRLNSLESLSQYQHISLCAGTSQAFDHFYIKHHTRRFRTLTGEFMYHRAVFKQGYKHLDYPLAPLDPNDAVIISVPFSDLGSKHPDTNEILRRCSEMGVPVLLDMAYVVCSKNIVIDLDQSCIDTVVFSLSKMLYGAENLRVGIRFQKTNSDDGIDVFNSVGMNNRLDIAVAEQIIDTFKPDYIWGRYSEKYQKVIKDMGLQATDCIMFGLDDQDRYPELNRGNKTNRVCISDQLCT